jgi:hypothetical protein
MAMWNQSAIGVFCNLLPREPIEGRVPSLNAVNSMSAARPTVSRLRRIITAISVSDFATAPTAGCLDVADANFQMSFADVAALDEGRVYGDTDRRGASRPAAARYGIRAETCARSWLSLGVDRQYDGQPIPASP